MSEMKPTPGPWYAKNHVVYTDAMPKRVWGRDNEFSGPYIVMQTGLYSSPDDATTYANARLVAEAGTVFHTTGLTPRQLVEQRDALVERVKELEEALQYLMKWQVKNVTVWHNSAYDHASRVLSKSLPNTVAETPK